MSISCILSYHLSRLRSPLTDHVCRLCRPLPCSRRRFISYGTPTPFVAPALSPSHQLPNTSILAQRCHLPLRRSLGGSRRQQRDKLQDVHLWRKSAHINIPGKIKRRLMIDISLRLVATRRNSRCPCEWCLLGCTVHVDLPGGHSTIGRAARGAES